MRSHTSASLGQPPPACCRIRCRAKRAMTPPCPVEEVVEVSGVEVSGVEVEWRQQQGTHPTLKQARSAPRARAVPAARSSEARDRAPPAGRSRRACARPRRRRQRGRRGVHGIHEARTGRRRRASAGSRCGDRAPVRERRGGVRGGEVYREVKTGRGGDGGAVPGACRG